MVNTATKGSKNEKGMAHLTKTEHSVYKYAKRAYEKLEKTEKNKFELKASNTRDGLVIEGFANRHVIDRGADIIKTDAWDLGNFKKNPIILFNHGLDPVVGGTPIGKALSAEPTEDGLYIKVRISKSKSPLITMIRDLIEEGMLQTFSVGFEAKERDVEEMDGKSVNVIKKAELFEVSVVGVPMNQDSTFEVTGKMLKYKTLNQVKSSIYHDKESWVASAANLSIIEMMKENISRSNIIKSLARRSGLKGDEVRRILAGDVNPVPTDMLMAMAVVLKMDLDVLERLNKGELEAVSKLEQEIKFAIGEEQAIDEESETEEGTMKDNISDSVKQKIPELLKEGMEKEQAVAVAFAICSEGQEDPTADDFKAMLEWIEKSEAKTQDSEDDADDEDKDKEFGSEEESEDDEKEESEESKQADQEEVSDSSQPLQTAPDDTSFGSPHLDQAKQTNVLLGTMVEQQQVFVKEVNTLNNNLTELIDVLRSNGNNETMSEDAESTEEDDEPEDDMVQRSLDKYNKCLENVRERINKMT